MRSAVPQKLRSGNAARNLVANARTCSRPRQGACREYSKRMSGAARSSMTAGLKSLPQNSVNQRPTISLFSSTGMFVPFLCVRAVGARVEAPHLVDDGCVEDVRCGGEDDVVGCG